MANSYITTDSLLNLISPNYEAIWQQANQQNQNAFLAYGLYQQGLGAQPSSQPVLPPAPTEPEEILWLKRRIDEVSWRAH